jgi:hypothetical protein
VSMVYGPTTSCAVAVAPVLLLGAHALALGAETAKRVEDAHPIGADVALSAAALALLALVLFVVHHVHARHQLRD